MARPLNVAGRPRPSRASWEEVAAQFHAALENWYRQRGVDLGTPQVQATLRTNSELVPPRGDNLLRWLSDLGGLDSLRALRVLELGSGFGALAAYLAWREQPAEVVAVDVRDDYRAVGSNCAERAGLDDVVRYVVSDMRDLAFAQDESFDVLLANNSFIYLTSRADADRALAEFERVLAPGGLLLFHHANKWRWREPFSGDPLIHLMPPPVARGVARMTGWSHNHGRVRLVSPRELRRRLRRAGFHDCRALMLGGSTSVLSARRPTFYTLVARVAKEA